MTKSPKMSAAKAPTKERVQGHIKGSGVDKAAVKAKVPQDRAKVKYGNPTQTQKM